MLNVLNFQTVYITPSDVVESLVAAAMVEATYKEVAIYKKILPIAVVLTYS